MALAVIFSHAPHVQALFPAPHCHFCANVHNIQGLLPTPVPTPFGEGLWRWSEMIQIRTLLKMPSSDLRPLFKLGLRQTSTPYAHTATPTTTQMVTTYEASLLLPFVHQLCQGHWEAWGWQVGLQWTMVQDTQTCHYFRRANSPSTSLWSNCTLTILNCLIASYVGMDFSVKPVCSHLWTSHTWPLQRGGCIIEVVCNVSAIWCQGGWLLLPLYIYRQVPL